MTIRRLILLLTCTAVILALTGCSSVNPNSITVTMTTAPPAALPAGGTASVAATVTNDSRHEGVDWAATCGSSSCGSFSSTHTASGASTTFTAPSDIPDGNVVNIIATSTRNPNKTATASPTIQFSNTMLVGNYVFEAAGQDVTSLTYQVAGVFTADGTGAITGGELTYSDFVVLDTNIPIDSGTYTIGTDGRGTITLVNSTDTTIGVGGTLTLGTVLANSSQALITQFDASATSSGTMDKQTAVNDPAGGFAFVVNGKFNVGTAIGGVFNIDSLGVISGAGSVGDIDIFGSITNTTAGSLTGTVSAVADDPLGSVTVDLSFFDGTNTADTEFIGYIVDDTHIKLIESDLFDITAGQAIGQGAATGTFADDTSFSGDFVFGISGDSAPGATAFAAQITADGSGGLTGTMDQNLGGVVNTGDNAFTGTYTVDVTTPGNTGRTTATTTFTTSTLAGPTLIFYLTSTDNSTPPLVINTDTFSDGAGIALPQSGPAFDGAYALNFSASTGTDASGQETDGTAQITSDGSAAFSGTGDINVEDNSVAPPTFTQDPGETVSGTFTASADGTPGRFDSTLTVGSDTFGTELYVADPTQGFIIENDDVQVALGLFIAAQE
jgi:hypothetical protein